MTHRFQDDLLSIKQEEYNYCFNLSTVKIAVQRSDFTGLSVYSKESLVKTNLKECFSYKSNWNCR
jgi:hypothetical protein